jgi:hypothetical protein
LPDSALNYEIKDGQSNNTTYDWTYLMGKVRATKLLKQRLLPPMLSNPGNATRAQDGGERAGGNRHR